MGGRPVVLYKAPQMKGKENYLKEICPEKLAACEEESTGKGELPCDETIYQLSMEIMVTNGLGAPHDADTATLLYKYLRLVISY